MAHIHELIDWTATVFIVHEDKVLLRWHEKYHILIGVGGHVELNEDPVQAAIRECKEEVGLDVTIYDMSTPPPKLNAGSKHLALPAHMNIHYIGGVQEGHQHIDLLYYAKSDSNVVVPENETDIWKWLTRAELEADTNIDPKTKFYALQALAVLGTK